MSASSSATLANRLWPSLSTNLVYKAGMVITGSLLLWASAKISVPFLRLK